MTEIEYIIGLRCTPYKRNTCGQGDTFFSTKKRKHVIILHPAKHCSLDEFDAAIRVLNHEVMHGILRVIAGNKACSKWDNISAKVGRYLGIYCLND